jgi:hypothetical protein
MATKHVHFSRPASMLMRQQGEQASGVQSEEHTIAAGLFLVRATGGNPRLGQLHVTVDPV